VSLPRGFIICPQQLPQCVQSKHKLQLPPLEASDTDPTTVADGATAATSGDAKAASSSQAKEL
jgi:hypothetical protein